MGTRDATATSAISGPVEAPAAEQHVWHGSAGESAARTAGILPLPARASDWLEQLADGERDQLPLWLPVALMAGIAAWFPLPSPSWWLAFMSLAVGTGLLLLATAGQRLWARALSLFMLIAACGCALIWARAETVGGPPLARAGAYTLTAAVEAVEPLPAREQVRWMLQLRDAPDLPARIRLNLPLAKAPAVAPGATVQLRAYLMPPAAAPVPGAYDFARRAWFEGIGATGRPLGRIEVLKAGGPPSPLDRMAGARTAVTEHIRERIGDPAAAGIAAALATGDQGAVPETEAEQMRRSGLAHLLSISGLHVTAVVGAFMLLTLRLLALSPALALRWNLVLIAAGMGALAGLGYTLFTGAQVPTVRACIAAMLVLAGIALGREAVTLRLVAVGAFVVLLFRPEALAGPSFQLSFAAVTAIVALMEHPAVRARLSRQEHHGWLAGSVRVLLALLLTGLAVELALAPIALFHFHKAGLYGALANIVAIPLTTFLVMPAEALALLFDVAGLGAPFWWVAEQGLLLLLWIAAVTAAAPGAVALLPSMPPLAFALLVAGGLWLCLWRGRVRRWGLPLIAAGAIWTVSVRPPDVLVTGDGRHLVLRSDDGALALLRPRAGDYVRTMLAEVAGEDGNYLDMEALPTAACSEDLCVAELRREGRVWRVLATRSRHFVRWSDMIGACRQADVVVSDRRLPRACKPRWLKADRELLARTGGLAIHLGSSPSVSAVRRQGTAHPWLPTD